jgi:DNA invertase Pin-like site-specific DNA recombinase
MSRPAAIYARVSSDRQKENHTIASQTAALREYAQAHDYLTPAEWVFEDSAGCWCQQLHARRHVLRRWAPKTMYI